MTATRQAKANKWKYIVNTVLDEDDDGILNLSCQRYGIQYIEDVLSLEKQDINDLTYIDLADKSERKTPKPFLAKLHIIKAWHIHLQNTVQLSTIDWSDKSAINQKAFNAYRVSIYYPDAPVGRQTQRHKPAAPTISTSTPTASQSLVSDFKKGIKRDKTHYTTLKDEKQWDEWKRRTIATIHAHGCENVVAPTYVPTTTDKTLLFEEQNKFMYDVFISIIQTSMGKHFVRKYESSRDAQKVWNDYESYMRTSIKGEMVVEELMVDLTSL